MACAKWEMEGGGREPRGAHLRLVLGGRLKNVREICVSGAHLGVTEKHLPSPSFTPGTHATG